MDDVQPYKFGTSEPQAPVSLSGMDRIGERVARQLRVVLENIMGTRPNLTTQSAEMVNFDLWSAMAPNFCSLSTYKLHPLKGSILVRIDAGMISSMVERFYGGPGCPAAAGGAGLPRRGGRRRGPPAAKTVSAPSSLTTS